MTDPSPQFPLLIFAEPANAERERLGGGRGRSFSRRPSGSEQGRRLGGKWVALENALENQTAALTADLQGVDPELVLVFEIVGDVTDFYRAVQRIEGFEYLAELDELDVDGDGVFVADDNSQTFNGTLFLLATNQAALAAVKTLWDQYVLDETVRFPQNLGRWKQVFRLLRDVRRWSARDRLLGTGALEDFRERQAAGQEVIPAEIELWYRSDAEKRSVAEQAVRRRVMDAGGQVAAAADISDIAYHAMLVHLPIQAIEPLLSDEMQAIELVRADEIAFVRPEAQAAVALSSVEAPEGPFEVSEQLEDAPPLVGVLDGVPLTRHALLDNRVELDDPEDWGADVPAGQRQHGTAIASLVLHGDQNSDDSSLTRPIYFRPILLPDEYSDRECIPHNQLAIDLVHRAVLRMVGHGGDQGIAPTVRVVNLSIGDANMQLAMSISPWARLLDWLSYRYKILFIVSAGNQSAELTYEMGTDQFRSMSSQEVRAATLGRLVASAHKRRLLSPAEAMNCLCVGAIHSDACTDWVQDSRVDILPSDGGVASAYPSPVSAVGMGYKRSIKPDLLAPGGRQLFRMMPFSGNPPRLVAKGASSYLSPGLLVATPSPRAGAVDGTRHFHGTSGAAAIVSHYCGKFLETLESLVDSNGQHVDPEYYAVLTKTMVVHTSHLPAEAEELKAVLGEMDHARLKDAISRFYGYGVIRPERVARCASSRATVMGWGELGDGEADVFDFPLPSSLSGKAAYRRLAVTVGYFSPIRNRDRRHRAAEIFVSPKVDALRVSRTDADWRTVRRGTLQHEVFSGTRAAAFVAGDSLKVQVNCRSATGRLPGPVHYGLAVTLEVRAQAGLHIYQEVAERIAQQVRTRVRGS